MSLHAVCCASQLVAVAAATSSSDTLPGAGFVGSMPIDASAASSSIPSVITLFADRIAA